MCVKWGGLWGFKRETNLSCTPLLHHSKRGYKIGSRDMSRGVLEAVLYNYLIYLYFNQLSFYPTTFYNE